MLASRLPAVCTVALLLCPASPAQVASAVPRTLEEVREVEAAADLAARLALGERAFPELPPVDASRLDLLENADRVLIDPPPEILDGSLPPLIDVTIPSSETGTGFPEMFEYLIPTGYDPEGAPVPMIIGYHGYSLSHNSVAIQSTLHVECDERGWIFVAPTGADQQIFGTAASQTNTDLAVQYMLDNFNVDPDRLYMVGFSMGGGITVNYVSRHRDPNGIMIAAAATVSATMDWTMEYNLGTPAFQTQVMQNVANFGASPAVDLFAYQRASGQYNGQGSYPPFPANLDEQFTMATNLESTPFYVTWDIFDQLTQVSFMATSLVGLLQGLGTEVLSISVAGTPQPHSWAVLNEDALFDWLDGRSVERLPPAFDAQLERDSTVSWATLAQRDDEAFSYVQGNANSSRLVVEGVVNAKQVTVDLAAAGLSGIWPLNVRATSADADGFRLAITGFDQCPSYPTDVANGLVVQGFWVDPVTDTLFLDVPGNTSIDADLILEPWLGDLWTSPQSVPVGGNLDLHLDLATGDTVAWMVVSLTAELGELPKNGGSFVASFVNPGLFFVLPLDAVGDLVVPTFLPSDPGLVGARVLLQAAGQDGTGKFDATTNLFALDIE